MMIKTTKSLIDGLKIIWSDESSSQFPWLWLRDHSETIADLHPDSKQRQIDVFTNTPNNSVDKVSLDKNSKNVLINWLDGTQSVVSFNLLKSTAEPKNPQINAISCPVT